MLAQGVFDAICNGVTIGDATRPGVPLIYVNPAFERMTGYSAEEAVGASCRFLQGPDTDQPGVHSIRAAIREGRAVRALLRNYRKDGTPFWNELCLSPIRDAQGALTHFVGIQNDVTAEMEAKLQLAVERDRLHAAAECSMDCLYICQAVRDAGGEIIDFTFDYLNTNVEKMVSIPLKTLLGARMCEVLPINRKLGLFDMYKRVVLTGEPLVHEFPDRGSGRPQLVDPRPGGQAQGWRGHHRLRRDRAQAARRAHPVQRGARSADRLAQPQRAQGPRRPGPALGQPTRGTGRRLPD